MVNCNVTTHATCPLALMAYKYNELEVSDVTQKLSYKANCKTPFFLIMFKKLARVVLTKGEDKNPIGI
jgi:hypothetical protein